MGGHSLLHGIVATQGSNLGLIIGRRLLYHLRHLGSPTVALASVQVQLPPSGALATVPFALCPLTGHRVSPSTNPLRNLQGTFMLDLMVPRGLTTTYLFKCFFCYFPAIFFTRDTIPLHICFLYCSKFLPGKWVTFRFFLLPMKSHKNPYPLAPLSYSCSNIISMSCLFLFPDDMVI